MMCCCHSLNKLLQLMLVERDGSSAIDTCQMVVVGGKAVAEFYLVFPANGHALGDPQTLKQLHGAIDACAVGGASYPFDQLMHRERFLALKRRKNRHPRFGDALASIFEECNTDILLRSHVASLAKIAIVLQI